jgi:ketosteroid isomerase-like protein
MSVVAGWARTSALGLIAVVAAVVVTAPASASEDIRTETWSQDQRDAEGLRATEAWLATLVKGEPAGVAAVLAPEFQIVRSDGSAYSKDEYVNGGKARIATQPKIEKLVATGFGDHLVVRYMLTVDETIDGKPVEAHAPRLSVFRKDGDSWLLVAHSNFAKVEQ